MPQGERTTFEATTELRSRRAVLSRVLLIAYTCAFPLMMGAAAFWRKTPAFMLFALPWTFAALLRSKIDRENWMARRRTGNVRASYEGLSVDGILAVPGASIGDVISEVRGDERFVRLLDRQGRVLADVIVDDDTSANAILSALGRGGARPSVTFEGLSPLAAAKSHLKLAMLTPVALVPFALPWVLRAPLDPSWLKPGFALGLFVAIVPWLLSVIPTKIDVGMDGVLIRWLHKRQFVPFDQLQELVAVGDSRLRLELFSDESIEIAIERRTDTTDRVAARRDAISDRIQSAFEVHRADRGARDLAALLGRGGRNSQAWLTELQRLRDGAANYREGALRDGDLWRVLESSSAPEDARAAAALLLRGANAEARERIRVAAQAAVSPQLRVALGLASSELATEGEAEVLAEFEDHPHLRRARRETGR